MWRELAVQCLLYFVSHFSLSRNLNLPILSCFITIPQFLVVLLEQYWGLSLHMSFPKVRFSSLAWKEQMCFISAEKPLEPVA